MNHVTHETARRLKEAGFPQPEPTSGMAFYLQNMRPGLPPILFGSATWIYVSVNHSPDELIFAPTATDILRELPDYWFLSVATSDPHGLYEMCISPEELAAAWLAIHEKKE